MGFSYRKSFKAGPIRITASKSGVSYSTKVAGVRVTKRANGRVTTSTSLPGGVRYTTSGGKKRATAARATPATRAATGPTPAQIKAAYQEIYIAAVQELRIGAITGAAIRGQLHSKGLTHPRILQAVTDAEKLIAKEAKAAAHENLAQQAAEQLRSGVKHDVVYGWLKRDQGIGFWDRGGVMSRAKKIAKGRA
jgi:hypothetical protein